jgi:hypothetical protein
MQNGPDDLRAHPIMITSPKLLGNERRFRRLALVFACRHLGVHASPRGCFWPADGGKHKPCLIMFCGRQGALGKYVVANSYGCFRSSRLANQAKSEVCRSSDGYRTRCTGALSPSHEAAQNGKVGENTTPYFWHIWIEVPYSGSRPNLLAT